MNDPIVIVGASRTPMGGFQGELSSVTASQLGGAAIAAALAGSAVDPADVDLSLIHISEPTRPY